MKFIFYTLLISVLFISCKDNPVLPEEEYSTIRGLWGSIELYDEFGEPEGDFSGVQLFVHVVDTLGFDSVGNATGIYDTSFSAISQSMGNWEFHNNPRGYYNITFSKDGYGDYVLYNYWYDTTRADTLKPFFLSTLPQASISLDSISYANSIINISRQVHYSSNSTDQYAVSTWYFFDTTSNVSKDNYTYAYVSGASYGAGGESKALTIQKPIDKLLESGFVEGDSVYVRAYIDNLKFQSYQITADSWAFPNILGESAVMSFYITPTE